MGPDDSCAYEPSGETPLIAGGRALSYGQTASDGHAAAVALEWSPEARTRMDRIPSFVRGVVTARVEKFARDRGYARIDVEVMEEVRRSLPVDFSNKLPFFLGGPR